jgi:hypothetical protein
MYVYKELKSYVDDEGFTFFDLKKTYTDDRLSKMYGLNIKDAEHQFNDANFFWLDVDQLHAKKKKST